VSIQRSGPDFLDVSVAGSAFDFPRILSEQVEVDGVLVPKVQCEDLIDCNIKCTRFERSARAGGYPQPAGCALCSPVRLLNHRPLPMFHDHNDHPTTGLLLLIPFSYAHPIWQLRSFPLRRRLSMTSPYVAEFWRQASMPKLSFPKHLFTHTPSLFAQTGLLWRRGIWRGEITTAIERIPYAMCCRCVTMGGSILSVISASVIFFRVSVSRAVEPHSVPYFPYSH